MAAEKPGLGFASSDKTVNDLLAEGYELKSSSVMMGVTLILQKKASLAICGLNTEVHWCQVSVEPAAVRQAIDEKAAARRGAPTSVFK